MTTKSASWLLEYPRQANEPNNPKLLQKCAGDCMTQLELVSIFNRLRNRTCDVHRKRIVNNIIFAFHRDSNDDSDDGLRLGHLLHNIVHKFVLAILFPSRRKSIRHSPWLRSSQVSVNYFAFSLFVTDYTLAFESKWIQWKSQQSTAKILNLNKNFFSFSSSIVWWTSETAAERQGTHTYTEHARL